MTVMGRNPLNFEERDKNVQVERGQLWIALPIIGGSLARFYIYSLSRRATIVGLSPLP